MLQETLKDVRQSCSNFQTFSVLRALRTLEALYQQHLGEFFTEETVSRGLQLTFLLLQLELLYRKQLQSGAVFSTVASIRTIHMSPLASAIGNII